MFKNSYWFRSGFYSVIQRLSSLLFGLGSFAILVRFLSKEDFGIYALFISVTSLIEVARIGLIQNALIKFLASAKGEEYKDVLSSSLVLNILITIVSVIVLIIISPMLGHLWNSPKIVPLFYMYCVTTVVLILFHQLNYLQQANLDFKGFFLSNFVRQGSLFIFIVLEVFVLKPIPDLMRIVIYMTVSALLGTLTSFGYGKKYLRISKKINYEWVKKIFNYGKYVFGTNISSMVFGSIDQFMLGSILPTSSVATFNAANRMSNLIDVPVASVAAIVFPQSAKRSSEEGNQSSAYLFEKSVGVLLALLLPALLFLFFFADLIISIIAGPKYFDAADILRVMVITGLFQPFVRQFGTVMDSIGKPKTNFYLILIVSLLNIVSNYLFITTFGTIGAAFGTLLTTIIFAVASQIILKNLIQVRFYAVFVYALMGYKEMFSQLLKVLSSLKSRLIR